MSMPMIPSCTYVSELQAESWVQSCRAAESCMIHIRGWMADNMLKLNTDKMEVIFFAAQNQHRMIISRLDECLFRSW